LGNSPAFARDPLSYLAAVTRDHGDIVGLRFGIRPAVLVNSPGAVEEVLIRNHRNFIKNKFFWRHVKAIFGQGLLTSNGELWQRQRRLAAPAFTPQRVASYGPDMVRHAARMLDDWTVGAPRDVHEDILALALIIALDTLCRAEVRTDTADLGHAVEMLAIEIAARRNRTFLIPDWVPLPGHIRYRRALAVFDGFVRQVIAERKADGRDRGDLLSALIRARDEAGQPMSDEQLRDEIITLLLAGHETTALTLSWTFYLLGLHPEADAKLADELGRVLGGRAPTVADIPALKFTEHVILESLRLYPPIWIFGRRAVSDCEIGGYSVPGGTIVQISPWLLHRDPRYFDEPAAFRPERWASGLAEKLPRFAYVPFAGGPRVCIGNRFALLEAVLLLATIAQRYRLELRSPAPIAPLASISLRPRGGVWVEPVPRA
jgi:cytochrome P450